MRENTSKAELSSKAELAMLGVAIPVTQKENVIYILDYIAKALDYEETAGAEIYAKATEFIDPKKTEIIGLSCSTLMGTDKVVNIIFKDNDGKPFRLDDPDGVLCYVYNFTCDWCSELGYSFFEKRGLAYFRIG